MNDSLRWVLQWALVVFVVVSVLFVGTLAARTLFELAAHVARYRRYRRAYPAADFGRVWRYTR
jgi:hypothetical protein